MTDYKKLFEDVSEFLTARGYLVVVEQVRDELATGRLSEEKIQTLKEVDGRTISMLDDATFKRSPPAEFVRRQDYSDTEALVLLVEAARRAIVDGSAMAAHIKSDLEDFGLQGLTFESDRVDRQGYVVPLDSLDSLIVARERALAIDELIRSIRES
ncbi:hypothetical protein [Paraburkholderia agricolaris]|uniref:hypothetical protein n=1 Tax=Paraburkholderia agricolaris TaxID=2152888 RepID=UPI001290FAA0|nr:hypothetical protein [Paraburkholderia agricolaris]